MSLPLLASIAETKAALRIDDGDLLSDSAIERLIEVASEQVVEYLKRRVIEVITNPDVSPPETEIQMDLTASPPLIPARVTQATIMLVGYLYRAPDSDPGKEWDHGALPRPVMSLLYQLRSPTFA
jgi:hypothetical protein